MKLISLTNLSKDITKGKCYEVIKETDNFYIVIDDSAYLCNIAKCFVPKFFKVVEDER